MKKKLICFDLDGTLLDSDEAHALAYNGAFEAYGLKKQIKKRLSKELNGQPGENIVRALFPQLSLKEAKDISLMHKTFIAKKFGKLVKPVTKNTFSSLQDLKRTYDLALVSNNNIPAIKALLKGAHIPSTLFKVIVGKDLVKRAKPFPDMIYKVEKLAKKKVSLLVGDSIYDLQAGRRAGVKTVAVLTGKFSRKDLEKEKPLLIVRNIDVLQSALKKQNVFKEALS